MAWTNPNKTWVTGEIVDASDMNTYIRDQFIAVLPVATLILRVAPYSAVETAVEGRWLQCNGVAVSRTTYSALFTYLSSMSPALPFGAGDGTTTFNLPDLRGRTVYGHGTNADVDTLGDNEGMALANRSGKHVHIVRVADFTGFPGNLIAPVQAKDSGHAASPLAVGQDPATMPAERGSYIVVGSYFIKYTA